MHILNVILGPIISEKSMSDAANGKYTFKVTAACAKADIKRAVEEQFKVNVVKVSTITVKGRSSRNGIRRVEAVKQPFKKAIVLLKKDQKISIFDTGGQK
jgi:large subunit ribosomal protein L23